MKGYRTSGGFVDRTLAINEKIIVVIMLTDYTSGFEINVQENIQLNAAK